MKNDLLQRTLDHALASLGEISKDEIQRLTLVDCAFILDTLPAASSLESTSTQLAEHLSRQLTPTWIREGDLLEVFLVLETLWKYDQLYISGEHLAYTIQRLVQSEVQVGGPYACDGIVDITANLQIASFVRLVAKPLPGLNTFFDQIVTSEQFKDTNEPYSLYLLAKLYDYPEVSRFITYCHLKTPAYRAIALPTVKHRTSDLWQELRAICGYQRPTGFWPTEALLHGRLESDIATTALIVKLLITYRDHANLAKASPGLQQRHQLVAKTAKQLFNTRAEPLRQSTLAAVDKICNTERTFEITLLSYFFACALKHPVGLSDQQFVMLGVANVCCWVAYTIYDDFLDTDGIPSQLPVANVTMRTSLECFRAVFPRQYTFERYIANVFTEMDEANAWEVHNCRFIMQNNTITIDHLPKYGRQSVLATRSFAHALGPMIILIKYTKGTLQQTHYIESAFRHYLIARQLTDDLHDWTDDIEAGQASYVVIAILRDMHLQNGTYNLPDLLLRMQKQFRRTTMPHVCLLALRHISKARQDFARSELLQPTNSIYTLLDELESSLRHSLDQHAKAKALVSTLVSYSS